MTGGADFPVYLKATANTGSCREKLVVNCPARFKLHRETHLAWSKVSKKPLWFHGYAGG